VGGGPSCGRRLNGLGYKQMLFNMHERGSDLRDKAEGNGIDIINIYAGHPRTDFVDQGFDQLI
jgi:hypothetical protein